jgi:DNA-binding CsgD family transcriptional regulator
VAQTGAGEGTIERVTVLGHLGAMAGDLGEFDDAKRYLVESLELAKQLGQTQHAARALRMLGIQASNQSNFAEATSLFQESLALFRALKDQAGIGRCLSDLGTVAQRQGEHDRAIEYLEQSLPIARVVGDDWQTCIILGNLGESYYDRGDFARGEARLHDALELARRIGDTFGVAVNLYSLGNCVFNLGDIGGALVRYRESLSLCVELGERHLASRALDRLGVALHRAGNSRGGARLFGAAAALREAIGDTLFAEEDVYLKARFQEVRNHLGKATYIDAWESGHTLPFERAAAEALEHMNAALLSYKSAPAQAELGLTVREAEVLRLLTDGHADKVIADKLFISTRTASSHVASVIAKLGVDSRTAAVAAAFRNGLV